jgi:hypothetical protein
MNAMGYWNSGVLEYWVWRMRSVFYMDDTEQKIKIDSHPPLIPNIPFFHHSNVPWVI